MLRRISVNLFMALLLCLAITITASAATLSPGLQSKLNNLADAQSVGLVIVAFNTDGGLNDSHLNLVRGVGITRGLTLNSLGMMAVPATAGQVKALAGNSAVRSIWENERLTYYDFEARTMAGVERVRTDAGFNRANGGLPVTGSGDFSVVINDSGIDATHPDLEFGKKVIQNVQVLTDSDTGTTCTNETGCIAEQGFTPLTVIENIPDTDLNVGHGTHCAGILGGTGKQSGGRYEGVAPGAKIIGTGSGAVLFVLSALGGYEWSLTNQAQYKIRVISNSYGSNGPYNPDNPLVIATYKAYQRNITSVFAAGNSGPGKDSHNRYSKAPWIISVGAGTKEGGLATFSSRGTPKDERLANNDPLDDLDAPTLVAPGTGREFEANASKFSAAYVSARSKTNMFSNGLDADTELPVGMIPFYTQISGTSMSTPFVAGVIALMLDADPTLSPDEIKQILTQTASRMPGYDEWEVGAGYVNVHAAVDKVFNRSKNYDSNFNQRYNAELNVTIAGQESFRIDYSPAALPGPGSQNSRTINVEPNMNVLDVFARFDNTAGSGDGNSIGLVLTDPKGNKYTSGIALPVLDGTTRQVLVKNPEPGEWLIEVRGVRGLAAVPNFSLPTSGAATPAPVDFKVVQKRFDLTPIADIQGNPAQAQIESVIKNRQMDTFADGLFHPETNVTREDLARMLFSNTALRQTVGASPRFTDVSADFAPIAEAVSAKGSTLRDYFTAENPQAVAGMMSSGASTFNPSGLASRINIAVALVRALGLDSEAKAMVSAAGYTVTALNKNDGKRYPLADNNEIPLSLRGYVQIALDKELLQAFYTMEQGQFDLYPTLKARVKPNEPTTRAYMAYALDNFRKRFVAGD